MTSPSAPKDKFFEKVINPYLAEVLQHPQTIEMREGLLHIRDVEGPRKHGGKARGIGATSFQVSGDGGAWTRLQSHNDHGVHQQPQAGRQGHWGGHLQAS